MASSHESKKKAPLHGLRAERGDAPTSHFPNAAEDDERGGGA
jgi:hypothetical protein